MKILHAVTALALFSLGGCVTSPRAGKDIEVGLSHARTGNTIAITATLTNHTRRSFAIIEHLDFYWIGLEAADKSKQIVAPIGCILWERPTWQHMKNVPPGESIDITWQFPTKRLTPSMIQIEDDVPYGPPSFRVWDKELRATFRYARNSALMPHFWWLSGRRFIDQKIEADICFPVP